jgi:hypothetical protein
MTSLQDLGLRYIELLMLIPSLLFIAMLELELGKV